MSKGILPELVDASPNRRSFLKKIGAATAAIGAVSLLDTPKAQAQTSLEVSILQFILNQEYLESELYTHAVSGAGIETFGIAVTGLANSPNPTSGGTTSGAAKVTFSDPIFAAAVAQIAADERAHVSLIRTALGSNVIAKPNINFAALGAYTNELQFMGLARVIEENGLSGFAGATAFFTTPLVVTGAGRILGAEGQHLASLRLQIARQAVPSVAVDGADVPPPPTGPATNILSVNPANGLVAVRTPGQALYLAYGQKANATSGGLYPNGVNGPYTVSTGPATAANLELNPPATLP